jgi:hypothetical protein
MPKRTHTRTPSVTFNGEPILATYTATQLGVIQSNSKKMNSIRVTDNVETAHNATYALVGPCVHGTNGINLQDHLESPYQVQDCIQELGP